MDPNTVTATAAAIDGSLKAVSHSLGELTAALTALAFAITTVWQRIVALRTQATLRGTVASVEKGLEALPADVQDTVRAKIKATASDLKIQPALAPVVEAVVHEEMGKPHTKGEIAVPPADAGGSE